MNKWGDGGAHLHVAFLGRPTGMLQLRGSNLALWDDMLPPLPAPVADAALYPRGQCGVTALVLQDHLGGELLLAEVTYEGGGSQGVHFMNRLRDGTEVDLTREQFAPHELVGEPRLG